MYIIIFSNQILGEYFLNSTGCPKNVNKFAKALDGFALKSNKTTEMYFIRQKKTVT